MDLVVALDGDVECLFFLVLRFQQQFNNSTKSKVR